MLSKKGKTTANCYGLPITTSVLQHGRFKGHSFYYRRILQETMGQGGFGPIKSRRVILNRTTLLNTDLVVGSEKIPLNNDRLRFRLAILNRFSAILLCCDSAHFFASRCGNSGDSKPAIPGIVRFAIRDSVPLSEGHSRDTSGSKGPRDSCSRPGGLQIWFSMPGSNIVEQQPAARQHVSCSCFRIAGKLMATKTLTMKLLNTTH